MSALIGKIDYREGWMCVLTEYADFNQPKRVRQWWRIERADAAEHALIDLTGCYAAIEHGRAVFKMGTTPFAPWAQERTVPTENGKTYALATEVVDFPCPKVRKGIETRYRNGSWEKYLKASGWVRCST